MFIGCCLLFLSHSVFAAEPDQLLICANCQSDASFKQYAQGITDPNVSNLVVINLETRQAKAFRLHRVFFGYGPSSGFQTVAVDMPLPTDVVPAIQGYHELTAAFAAHRRVTGSSDPAQFKAAQQGLINSLQQSDVVLFNDANGCGTPSDPWTYPLIPDYPFRSACDAHDLCYTTGRSKTSCDQEFLFNMKNLILPEAINAWWTSATGKLLLVVLLDKQAEIYYAAVTQSTAATNAYCAATQNKSAAECAPNAPLTAGSFSGYDMNRYPRYDYKFFNQTCELWRFPDGYGSYYYMHRNCRIYM